MNDGFQSFQDQFYIEYGREFVMKKKKNSHIKFYTDGSYNPKKNQYGWSFVTVIDGKQGFYKYGSGSNPSYLSSRQIGGELVAVLQALNYAEYKGYDEVCICYDYEGIEKWADGTWAASSAIAQSYVYLIGQKVEKITVHFKKVKAHANDPFNLVADRLAKKGANQ